MWIANPKPRQRRIDFKKIVSPGYLKFFQGFLINLRWSFNNTVIFLYHQHVDREQIFTGGQFHHYSVTENFFKNTQRRIFNSFNKNQNKSFPQNYTVTIFLFVMHKKWNTFRGSALPSATGTPGHPAISHYPLTYHNDDHLIKWLIKNILQSRKL